MIWDSKAYNDTLNEYKRGRTWLNNVSVEIEGGEATVDPMFLLRAYDADPTVDNYQALASAFCMNKRVVFRNHAGAELFSFVYTGGDLSSQFSECPYLLDVLHQAAYAMMIKKLTPPSTDSVSEERPSA